MKIVSINTSQSKQVQHLDKMVSTGIFKQPRNEKVFVGKTNLDGDAQADLKNHGGEHKAVYAFSADHYDYWRQTLSRPDLSHGVFGENLTITALNESTLCIGDKLCIGQSVLQISQPRVPCFKLALAFDNQKMPNLFTKHFATGIYFRVLQQGFITPGDPVTVIKNSADSLSVQTLFQAYYDRTCDNALDIFKKALEIEALAPEWQEKLLKKLQRQ